MPECTEERPVRPTTAHGVPLKWLDSQSKQMLPAGGNMARPYSAAAEVPASLRTPSARGSMPQKLKALTGSHRDSSSASSPATPVSRVRPSSSNNASSRGMQASASVQMLMAQQKQSVQQAAAASARPHTSSGMRKMGSPERIGVGVIRSGPGPSNAPSGIASTRSSLPTSAQPSRRLSPKGGRPTSPGTDANGGTTHRGTSAGSSSARDPQLTARILHLMDDMEAAKELVRTNPEIAREYNKPTLHITGAMSRHDDEGLFNAHSGALAFTPAKFGGGDECFGGLEGGGSRSRTTSIDRYGGGGDGGGGVAARSRTTSVDQQDAPPPLGRKHGGGGGRDGGGLFSPGKPQQASKGSAFAAPGTIARSTSSVRFVDSSMESTGSAVLSERDSGVDPAASARGRSSARGRHRGVSGEGSMSSRGDNSYESPAGTARSVARSNSATQPLSGRSLSASARSRSPQQTARSTVTPRVYPYVSKRQQAIYEAKMAERQEKLQKLHELRERQKRVNEKRQAMVVHSNRFTDIDLLTDDELMFLDENQALTNRGIRMLLGLELKDSEYLASLPGFNPDAWGEGPADGFGATTAKRIMEARKRRVEAEEAEQRAIQRRLNLRKMRREEIARMQEELKLQRKWLLCVGVLSRLNCFNEALLKERQRQKEVAQELRMKRAIKAIEPWYIRRRYRHLMSSHHKAAVSLNMTMRLFWRVVLVRRRRKAAALLRDFLTQTSVMGTSMAAMYRYRACVKRAQRWVKSFIVCKRARLQMMYRAVVRAERRRHDEAVREVKMAELIKKAKERQAEANRSCFGHALKDHVVIDVATRKMLNKQENRLELRLNKKQERLSNMLEGVAQKEEVYARSRRSHEAQMLLHAAAVQSTEPAPFHALSPEQKKWLRNLLGQMRRQHVNKHALEMERVSTTKAFKEVEVADVKRFLQVDTEVSKRLAARRAALMPTQEDFDKKIADAKKLINSTFLLLTQNNSACLKALENAPPEIFNPSIATDKGPVSIMNKHRTLALLISGGT